MAILKVTINDNDLQQALREALSKAHDLQPVLIAARERLLLSVRQNFQAGGRPTRWPPSRRAIEQGGQTLVDTARLRNSITGRIERHTVVVGTNVEYGRRHQLGIGVRARPFLLVQESDITYVEGILREYLEQPLREA